MRTVRASRPLIVALAVALAAVVFGAVAFASGRDSAHPRLLPAKLIGVPELSAVVWNEQTKSFIQFQVDRGKITAVSGSTITVQQGTGGNVWRTQSFAIPADAEIHVNGQVGTAARGNGTAAGKVPKTPTANPVPGRKVTVAQLKVGMHVRIVQTGPVGGSLQIVRVDANRDRDLAVPSAG